MGAMDDAILGMKPWTRVECARLLNEAEDRFADADEETQPARLYKSLREEFAPELKLLEGESNTTIRLESVYTRFTEIGGPPLTDGYHFGQTLYNDFGKPFEQGFNSGAGCRASKALSVRICGKCFSRRQRAAAETGTPPMAPFECTLDARDLFQFSCAID
jgi:hypothetical protein